MKLNKEYGYTVCYKNQGSKKWKVYIITNTYDFALWHIRWYEREPPKDRKTQIPMKGVEWLVIPIKNFMEYRRLWRSCPFDP